MPGARGFYDCADAPEATAPGALDEMAMTIALVPMSLEGALRLDSALLNGILSTITRKNFR